MSNPMSTQTLASRYRQPRTRAGEVTFKDPPLTVCASVRVRTETRRLFQAVVVPEYLDAWLRVPEQDVSWAVAPLQQTAGFVLNWRIAGVAQSQILAIYKTCRRRKLIVGWKLHKNNCLTESRLIMNLNGDFGCSVLTLFHTGFGTFDDFAWHRQLWHLSLERLANLF